MQIQDTEAVEKEDEEEEEEKNDDDSQDMFGETQDNLDNPLLGVRPRTVASHNTISNSRSESRNPFAKKDVEKNTGSLENSPGTGIAFDSSAVAQKPLLSRKPLLIPNKKVSNILFNQLIPGWPKCTDCTDFFYPKIVRIVRIVRIFFSNCTDCSDLHLFYSILTRFSKWCMKIFKKKFRQNEVSLTYFLYSK